MPTGTRICKVCGNEYEYCRTLYPDNGIYRWQDVACCAEHGSIYFARVMEARGESIVDDVETRNTAPDNTYQDNDIVDEQDPLFDDDFSDDDSDLDIG